MLLQGELDGGIDPGQLLLGQLQADGVGELGIHLAVELIQQADAGVDELGKAGPVFVAHRLAAAGDEVVQILVLLEQLVTLLAQFELGQVQVGDLLLQVLHQGGGGRFQLLVELIEDAREQQVALEHLHLFVEVALGLGAALQHALRLQVLLGQGVEAVGGADELLAELVVELLLFLHQGVVFGGHQFAGLFGGLLGIPQALGAALLLQCLQFLLFTGETGTLVVPLLDHQILHAGAVVQLLLQVGQLQIQQGQLGIKLHLLGAAHPVPGVEAGADLLAALIGAAHAGLGPLRQGLQVGDLAADGAKGLLGRLHVGHDLGLAGIELRQAHGGVFALELLRALALGQGVELGADLLELCRQGAQAFALGFGLALLLVDAVEEGEGVSQELLVRLLAGRRGVRLAEGVERPLHGGALGQILRQGARGPEGDE